MEHVKALAGSRAIDCPVYDFATHTRLHGRTVRMEPAPVLLVEGILALHYPELRKLYDFSIYVDAPAAVCLNRRIARDIRERGRTEASVREQYEATTRPMADLYVLPSAAHASITVDGAVALDWPVEQILKHLHSLRLLP